MSTHLAAPATARPRRTRSAAAVVGATAIAAIAATGVAITAATHQDRAHLNLGTEGIGSPDPFDIVLVDAEGTVHDAPAESPLELPLHGAELLVPGRTVETTVLVANNHPAIATAATTTLLAEPVPGTPDITPFLRYSVVDGDGQSLVGGTAEDPAGGLPVGDLGDLGHLTARGAEALDHGAPWSPGEDGSARAMTVLVHMLADPATAELNGGQASLTVRVDGTSVEP